MAELGKVALFAGFDTNIDANGNNEITGPILNTELKNVGDSYPNKADDLNIFLRDYVVTGLAYKVGEVCIESNKIYRCNTPTSGAFTLGDWDLITDMAAGTPGGADTQLQYNKAGAFGGISEAVYTSGASLNFDSNTLFINITGSNVGFGTAAPNASALVDIVSTTQGFGLPAMDTTARDLISTPRTGLSIYNTSTNAIEFYSGAAWVTVLDGGPDGNGIYGGNGSLSANTTVTMGANTLGFVGNNTGFGTASPNASALVDLVSTTSGFGLPSMTTGERDLVGTPRAGLMVYNNSTNTLDFYNGSAWGGVADGNGIYDGSGTIPTTAVSTITDTWQTSGGKVGINVLPNCDFHVKGSGSGGTVNTRIVNSADVGLFVMFNNGQFRIGENASSNDNDGVAVGRNSTSTGTGVAVGTGTTAPGSSVAVGSSASTGSKTGAIAIGNTANASGGNGATAIGENTIAGGNATMLGRNATGNHNQGVGVGESATVTGANGAAVGAITTAALDSLACGYDTDATASRSISVGQRIANSGADSAVFGGGTSAGLQMTNTVADVIAFGIKSDTPTFYVTGGDATASSVGNLGLGVSAMGTNAELVFGIKSGVAPTTRPADIFQMYAADIAAGNSAPHFMTENNEVIKLYQTNVYTRNATVVEDRTLLASASATTLNNNNVLAALIADLQSIGIIG